ncbi:right-handed parallel beta-helix repeat-containing protein [Tuwongella immobilis]|uniref:Right handed beta helix domain-containing protein n=1 Tax=Tuwongella immobilis TaxID=692036 RepID=A0A6C2YUX6_9BACT|nr:right-handed parallel beta-helix repeat-containing protein [Tuwongella immobilis]VIP05538.1 serine threonine protein : Tlr1036 protein OS=Thermosynechococcus elongatus (strain BP-1) GN=tlr1036 PE=4 SV=1: Beta_helix [Tuwongella immobilis]VTS08432.1 serine threonine protein : Tlr1036 protein OS=Thermosynechococcus elongatus (strain BP-1) GN=tlr1036 PE=4 SV=1: Beta_helix [Tuwongella immobilis]
MMPATTVAAMRCPYCYGEVARFEEIEDPSGGRSLSCPRMECRAQNIPMLYQRDYHRYPPMPCSIIGLSNHGKTEYINALLDEFDRIGRDWPGFHYHWLSETALREARNRLEDRAAGRLSNATRSVFPDPQMLRLANVPNIGGNHLIIYDTGGETFEDAGLLRDAGRYVRNSPSIIWLVSLSDLDRPTQLSDMLTIYQQAMIEMGGNPKQQTLILVLTKGDLLLEMPELPASCSEFLQNDRLDPRGDSWGRLQQISDDLERWLTQSGYHNLVNFSRESFREVRYCIVSALGTSADGSRMEVAPMPRGVMAPIFWLWRSQHSGVWVQVGQQRSLYLSLPEAIQAAPAGAIITLEPGTYLLPEPIVSRRTLRLHGSGLENTIIRCMKDEYVIHSHAPEAGGLELRNLTIEHAGNAGADVVRVTSGKVLMERCRIRGGRSEGTGTTGSGLIVSGGMNGRLVQCEFTYNQGDGVQVHRNASLELIGCLCQFNERSGIHWLSDGKATITQTRCLNNKRGIRMERTQNAAITGNFLMDNTEYGIDLRDGSHGKIEQNRIEGNRIHGIRLVRDANWQLHKNACKKNTQAGIALTESAKGMLVQNECIENLVGILYQGQAELDAEENRCVQNQRAGIVLEGNSGGRLKANLCEDNQYDGVLVGDTARPIVDHNTFRLNQRYGIFIARTASQTQLLRGNQITQNRTRDIQDERRGGWFG